MSNHKLIDPAQRRDLVTGRYIHAAAAAVVAQNSSDDDPFDFAGMAMWQGRGEIYNTRDEQLARRKAKQGVR